MLTTYAMTEALPICSNPRQGVRDLETVGPAAGPEVSIVAPIVEAAPGPAPTAPGTHPHAPGGVDAELAQGVDGEVAVRGACVFDGYEWREHLGYDPNESAFLDGSGGARWLRTGDRGWMDGRGHVHLTGRFKEVVSRAGEKISPLAVEHALVAGCGHGTARGARRGDADGGGGGEAAGCEAGCGDADIGTAANDGGVNGVSAVRELLCFAAPHAELGEVVGVAVVSEQGSDVSLAELRQAVASARLLSRRWLPEILVRLRALPRGPTGKPLRIGFAATHNLPALSLHCSMVTVDLRHGAVAGEAAARGESSPLTVEDDASEAQAAESPGSCESAPSLPSLRMLPRHGATDEEAKELLRAAWCRVLALSAAEAGALTDDTPFGSLGGDSILAAAVAGLVAQYGLQLGREAAYGVETMTVSSLVARGRGWRGEGWRTAERIRRRQISAAQLREGLAAPRDQRRTRGRVGSVSDVSTSDGAPGRAADLAEGPNGVGAAGLTEGGRRAVQLVIVERDGRDPRGPLLPIGGLAACAVGNLEAARALAGDGWPAAHAVDKHGSTALMWAA